MQYTIEKDRPIPTRGVYATILRQLSVGDSVLLTDGQRAGTCHAVAHRIGIKITTRIETLGLRIWRIE